jgi:hypothetical protein
VAVVVFITIAAFVVLLVAGVVGVAKGRTGPLG